MIIDFKDLLLQHYRDIEFDIPMVADVIDNGAEEIGRIIETMLITNEAVGAAVGAGLDPMMFSIMNRDAYRRGGMLFYTAADDEWEYRLSGIISHTKYEGSYREGLIKLTEADPHPAVDVMRKKDGDDHWQIFMDGEWIENGPPVGYLEKWNEVFTNDNKQ